MKFDCPLCSKATEKVWTSTDGETVGFRCERKHEVQSGLIWNGEKMVDAPNKSTIQSRIVENPVFLVKKSVLGV